MTDNKKNVKKTVLIPLLFLVIISIIIYLVTEHFNKAKFVRYPAFGISLPSKYEIHGIDISHHQNNIDWDEVKAMKDQNVKIGFCFIKATEGIGRVDNMFRKNWYNSKKSGLPRGAYHFFIGSKSGKAQAANFIETVQLSKGDMPPVLDIEQANGATPEQLIQRAKEWLQTVEAYYQVKPVIYTYVDFYEKYLSKGFEEYDLWIAHYLQQDKPRIQRKWIFWQHNEKGRVNGIDALVDCNVFNGDSTDFKEFLIQ
ncbi:MAG: glycoside hydrolase family 25 protein [Chitinophagaceae bacterium]|nr:glycoside hydrolase family 25 protein [Chitinophagaceae bacterium]